MDKYIAHIAESKTKYHKNRSKMPYEDKVKVIIELQKLENEIIKQNKSRKNSNKVRRVWQLD